MLHGRSGASIAGISPLAYTTIQAWMQLMDIGELQPYEVEALLTLDSAFLLEDETMQEEKPPAETPPWPKRRAS